jgi:hypothetical protein
LKTFLVSDHLQAAALLDAVLSNVEPVALLRLLVRHRGSPGGTDRDMIRPFVEKGIPVPAAPVEDSSGVYLFGRESCGWRFIFI